MNEEFLIEISKLKETGKNFVIVTMVSVRGSAPQEIGARMIVVKSGLVYGTIGGGKIEEKSIAHAKNILEQETQYNFTEWNLQTDVGMTCGGVVGLFFEKIKSQPDWLIAVFGAGHVAQELVRLLIKLDCEVTCIDPRMDWLAKMPEHYKLKKIQSDDMKSILKTLGPKTFIASLTMGHAYDLPILKEALTNHDFPYLGAIGSDSKSRVLKNDLRENGIDEELIAKLHCPIGAPFGNNQPVEIAISIASQLITVREAHRIK